MAVAIPAAGTLAYNTAGVVLIPPFAECRTLAPRFLLLNHLLHMATVAELRETTNEIRTRITQLRDSL